jgi:hypothetical protein
LPTNEVFEVPLRFDPDQHWLDLPLDPRPDGLSDEDWGAYVSWVQYAIEEGGAVSGNIVEQDLEKHPDREDEPTLEWKLVGDLERARMSD